MPDMNENAETQQEYFGKAKLKTDYKDLSMRLYKRIADLEKSCDETQELLDKQIEATYKLVEENAELKEELKDANEKVVHLACNQNKDLISEPEEKKLKWTDLKIGDIIRKKYEDGYRFATVIRIDDYSTEKHIGLGGEWPSDDELAEWEKVEK